MVSLPGGSFLMGSDEDPSEKPVHRVTVKPFSIAKYPVTVREWKACVAAGACAEIAAGIAGDDQAPMTNVSWDDAMQFVAWLSKTRNEAYRLPSEAEWEYAARGGRSTKYWWGNAVALGMADCKGCGEPYDPRVPLRVGSFPPNPFGLYDMTGDVAEWVADCWHRNYQGAPAQGVAWSEPDCGQHVLRGGSWENDPSYLRAASRDSYDGSVRYISHGFRLARSP
jgi:formylglycine-generating enzyme required for sulfatase activity